MNDSKPVSAGQSGTPQSRRAASSPAYPPSKEKLVTSYWELVTQARNGPSGADEHSTCDDDSRTARNFAWVQPSTFAGLRTQ
ncbi:MAG: hypothetical protein KGL39_44065 [Patescibacteria group bacterium]|nr:hypothetical protein [Patescibacteria group bacterium]